MNKGYACDLHIHSVYSDGTDTPLEICRAAFASGVEVLSITDHDGLGSTKEKKSAAISCGLKYITGLELSAYEDDKQVHILGYGVNEADEKFLRTLKKLDQNRLNRTEIMLERLKKYYGIEIGLESVKQTGTQSVGSMHLARALVAKGFAKSVSEAFSSYIGYGQKAYCPELRQTPEQAVLTINEAGGKAVLAHPGKLKTNAELMVKKLKDYGLFGIEAMYSSHTLQQTEYFKKLAEDFRLIITVGSDYHGKGRLEKIGVPKARLSEELLSILGM